ncbi:MAG: ABC transporter permease [Bacteroidota bacterium]|nr:ABC transporter permease [Bacteroidota bacterium]
MYKFIIKEFHHIFRDFRTMIILFGMPVVQVLLFGFAITTDIKDARIAILDKSNDYMTHEITNKLLSSGYFILGANLDKDAQIDKALRRGDIREVVIFEKNFADKIKTEKNASVQIIADASDPNMANLLFNYTRSILSDYQRELFRDKEFPMQIQTETRMLYNPELKSVYMFVPGIITILLMLISAMMTSISIAREKELGTMEVLLVSPLKPFQIVIGKVIPYVLLSCINASVIFLLSFFIFGMPVQGNLLFLLAETVLFIMMSLSLGIFISTVSQTQQIAMMLSMFALMLPTILLSGFIFPIENMPVVLQYISMLMPSRWFIIIIKAIMLKGLGISYLWKETLVIVGLMLFFIAMSVRKFKVRLA